MLPPPVPPPPRATATATAATDGRAKKQQTQTLLLSPPPPPPRPTVVAPGFEDERRWFNKLSESACRHAQLLRVCSHRGTVSAEGVASGSLAAFALLYKAGVRSFDVDFVQTSDGRLLAAHPDDLDAAIQAKRKWQQAQREAQQQGQTLQEALPSGVDGVGTGVLSGGGGGGGIGGGGLLPLKGHVAEYSLAALREAGASEDRFPTAELLIKAFAGMLVESSLLWKPVAAAAGGQELQQPDYEQLPVLLIDLKGPAYNEASINNLSAMTMAAGVAAHVAMYAVSDQQQQMIEQKTTWEGPLIFGFQDRGADALNASSSSSGGGRGGRGDPAVSASALLPFAMLGPSLKLSDAFFAAAAKLGKPLFAWVVDDAEALHRALELGVSAAISDRPLAVRSALLDWRDRCSDRQGSALGGVGAGDGIGGGSSSGGSGGGAAHAQQRRRQRAA